MKGMYIVSAMLGLFCGLAGFIVLLILGIPQAERWALIGGLAVFAGILLIMMQLDRRMEQRRIAALALLPSPCTHQFTANLCSGRELIPVAICLCQDTLCLVNLERKPAIMSTYASTDILRLNMFNAVQAEITLTQGRRLYFRAVRTEELLQALREKGWLPFQA
ncbi:MAG: hypothetical protein IJZ74_08840 [Clostridia bacterium]|nr:hypothetical protein [Clostridia bacterium]